jgi:alkylation response protein AidB-like acyl-CoA dehydrogenase
MWITNGPVADTLTILATTNPSLGVKGLNFFLVEKGYAGFSSGQVLDKLGCRGTITGEVVLDNVKVPAENLLGEELNKGAEYLSEILDEVRVMTGAMALGIARAAYGEGLEYARKRIAFGNPIGSYQLIRAKFADMATEMEAARLMVYYAAWRIKEKLSCRKEAGMAKMFATETCLKVVDEVTRIWGANAFAREYNPQRHFRDARFLLYGGGTHEILRDFLGRLLIGKMDTGRGK